MGKQKKTASKAYPLRLSATALHNIDEITGYLAFLSRQPHNAIKACDAIYETFDRIRTNPLAFKECPELVAKTKFYRQSACLSWLIIYKIVQDEITILGIIHQSKRPWKVKTIKR